MTEDTNEMDSNPDVVVDKVETPTIKIQDTIEAHNTHIKNVDGYISRIISELRLRGANHDKSKNQEPELSIFATMNTKLKDLEYGSEEYKESLKKLGPALDHHYANNRHHPEHFKNGISDMDIVDLVEMLCDWKAASQRHNTGNIQKSIELNAERFGMCDQLVSIFENSTKFLD